MDLKAYEILIQSSVSASLTFKTKLSMKGIEWKQDYRMVKLDNEFQRQQSALISEDEIEVLEDPGPCPIFKFMPTKVQLMKMIIKAAFK